MSWRHQNDTNRPRLFVSKRYLLNRQMLLYTIIYTMKSLNGSLGDGGCHDWKLPPASPRYDSHHQTGKETQDTHHKYGNFVRGLFGRRRCNRNEQRSSIGSIVSKDGNPISPRLILRQRTQRNGSDSNSSDHDGWVGIIVKYFELDVLVRFNVDRTERGSISIGWLYKVKVCSNVGLFEFHTVCVRRGWAEATRTWTKTSATPSLSKDRNPWPSWTEIKWARDR